MKTFFYCKHCGNLVGKIIDSNVPLSCCGEVMSELTANTVDASTEKHVPTADFKDGILTVNVGSVDHPMTEEHLINFIYVSTEKGGQRKGLKANEKPFATFAFVDDKPTAVFAYCNLHGLWKIDL